MKNKAKFVGIFAIAAFFGFTLISCENLLNNEIVAMPRANPGAGTYDSARTVTLSCDTSGASIFYTTNGSAPDADSNLYSAPILISETTTLKAIAVKDGMNNSRILTAVYTIGGSPKETVAMPTASPAGGTYISAQTVTLSCATGGASIYYTIDGSAPTAASTLYSSSSPVTISATTTLKAFAVKAGMDDSSVLIAVYTINDPQLPTVATPAATPLPGIYPSAQTVTLSCVTAEASIYYTLDDSTPTAGSSLYSSPVTISATTTLKAVAVKDGMNNSSVLTAVYTINEPGKETVAMPTASPSEGTYTSTSAPTVFLFCATNGASIYYTLDESAPTAASTLYSSSSPITISATTTLKAIAVKANMNNSVVLTAVYTINNPQLETVATPTANLSEGPYTGEQTVTLSCATSGASIKYTVNGDNPQTHGIPYTGPITIGTTTTLEAIAVKAGMNDSDVFRAVYTINNPQLETVATPTANLPEGPYTGAQTVTLSCTESGANIYYTTNGSTPTTGSTSYSTPITISQTTTLKAIAIKPGMNDSAVFTADYTINLPTIATPTASPAGGTFTSAQTVTLSCSENGASIRYTINGTDPTDGSTAYSSPITISQTTTLKAIAIKPGMNDSAVLTAVYTINIPGKTLSSIAVTTPPTKTQYNLNEALNTAGMVVTATYSDNSTAEITTGYTTSDFSSTTAGQKTVTVTYEGKTATFTVTVVNNNIEVTFSNVTANGSASQTTTQLTLTFSSEIVGLTAADITLSGVNNVSKGTLGGSGPTRTLPISGFTSSGTLNVAVAKTGYTISIPSRTVPIFYYSAPLEEDVLVASYAANASNTHIAGLTSLTAYSIVNRPAETRETIMKVVNPGDYAAVLYSLAAYKDTQITITFSADVKRVGAAGNLNWQINNDDYPSVGSQISNAAAGTWHPMSGTWTGTPGNANPSFYLSTYENSSGSTTYYIDNFVITITPVGSEPSGPVTKPTDSRILNPVTTNTQLTGNGLTVSGSNHGGGNKWLIQPTQPPQSRAYGYETWDEAGSPGNASFTWYGKDKGGGLAFKAEWTNVKDFLARTGYNWDQGNPHTYYGNIYCGFNFTRSARYNGNFSYIGIYGWSRNPGASVASERLVEYYIVEDSYGNRYRDSAGFMLNIGNETLGVSEVTPSYTMDDGTYKVFKVTRTGPSIAGDTTFTQFFSVRQTPRQNGTISVTEHFKKWAERGMNLGTNIYECKFKVEAGGNENGDSQANPPVSPPGTGTFDARLIQFYRANDDGTIIEITQ